MYSVNRVTEFSEHQQIKLQNVYILFYQLKNIYDCIFFFFFLPCQGSYLLSEK